MLPRWVIFDYPGFSETEPVRQAVPLFPDVTSALTALISSIPDQVHKSYQLPGWKIWETGIGLDSSGVSYPSDFIYFRGQARSYYNLMPTLFRGAFESSADPRQLFIDRQRKAEQLRKRIFSHPHIGEALPEYDSFTEGQALALTRHYGAPSELIDFSTIPDVAAFFATLGDFDTSSIGVIYTLNLIELLSLPGCLSIVRRRDGFEFKSIPTGILDLRYLRPNPDGEPLWEKARIHFEVPMDLTFHCIFVPQSKRISNQRGAFFKIGPIDHTFDILSYYREAGAYWCLLRFLCSKTCFFQTSGIYSNPSCGIEKSKMLPTDDPILTILGDSV